MSLFFVQYFSGIGHDEMIVEADNLNEAYDFAEENLMFYDDEFFVEEYDESNLYHKTVLEREGIM